MYEIGIDDSEEYNASITMASNLTTSGIEEYAELSKNYKIVLIDISFNTYSIDTIEELIVNLHNSDQVFMINTLEYSEPDGENLVAVSITMFSYYEEIE